MISVESDQPKKEEPDFPTKAYAVSTGDIKVFPQFLREIAFPIGRPQLSMPRVKRTHSNQ